MPAPERKSRRLDAYHPHEAARPRRQVTIARGALSGALGAVGSQFLLGGAPSMIIILAPLGALLGASSFAIARRTLPASVEPELIEAPPPVR